MIETRRSSIFGLFCRGLGRSCRRNRPHDLISRRLGGRDLASAAAQVLGNRTTGAGLHQPRRGSEIRSAATGFAPLQTRQAEDGKSPARISPITAEAATSMSYRGHDIGRRLDSRLAGRSRNTGAGRARARAARPSKCLILRSCQFARPQSRDAALLASKGALPKFPKCSNCLALMVNPASALCRDPV